MGVNGRDVTFIVHCYLDVEERLPVATRAFMQSVRKENWVKYRLDLFYDYTMKSLMNQSFKDFRIFLLCGNEFKKLTEVKRPGMPVEIYYDFGIEQYTKNINTNFVAITRIDSDDLFHKNTMKIIADQIAADPDIKEMTFRKWLFWDKERTLIRKRKLKTSPFVTKVYPKNIYKRLNEESYYKHLFENYREIKFELPPFMVCTILHNGNVTWRRSKKTPTRKEHREKIFENPRHELSKGSQKCLAMLKPFGMTVKEVIQ